MSDHPLSEREELILRVVVHQYITSAEPVGSRAIVKRYDLEISPATVRNVMSDLEDNGYLEQLHTSSGRVPTDKGYRYYVDYLMSVQELTRSERQALERDLRLRMTDADQAMRETSRLLALLSHHTGIVQAPGLNAAVVRSLEVLPVSSDRLAVLIIDSYGRVRTIVVSVKRPLSSDELTRLNPFLNEHLHGIAVDNLSTALETKMRSFMDEQRLLAESAILLLGQMPRSEGQVLFLEGASQLMDQPEFHDIDKAKEVFGLLEERERVMELLRTTLSDQESGRARILFGVDNPDSNFSGISVVAAPYSIDEERVGVVGVLGPRRMPYSKLSGLVEYTAGMLSRLLTRLAH